MSGGARLPLRGQPGAFDVDRVAAALLYEGYMLYPYRPSAVKNRRRFNFGIVSPSAGEAPVMQTEALVTAGDAVRVGVRARFLHLVDRVTGGEHWSEAIERVVEVSPAPPGNMRVVAAGWPAHETIEGAVVRHQCAVECELEVTAVRVAADVHRIRVRLSNRTVAPIDGGEDPLLRSLVSAHLILTVSDGAWVSSLDPPAALAAASAACTNVGAWPVMAGAPGDRDTMLASPIIMYDYPEIAAASAGDLFDATEIDEILSLRVLTLTDGEQDEIRHADAQARRLLERTQALSADDFMQMHGTMRRPDAAR